MRIIFVHLCRVKDNKLSETMSMLMKDWAKFSVNAQENISSEYNGMNRTWYWWIKLSSDNEVKARDCTCNTKIRAINFFLLSNYKI